MYTLTNEMQSAMELINNTKQHLFITGKAGTGKTTFLHHISNTTKKNHIICSPTGVAAINAGGTTLHSMFGIPFGPISPIMPTPARISSDKVKVLQSLELLIIDEISMVRADIIDFLDSVLKKVRKNPLPFGGVQLVMFGDLFQLPPVIKTEEKELLSQFYTNMYFFDALIFRNITYFQVVELTHIFRQTDERFCELLNNIRVYHPTESDFDVLDELKQKPLSDDKNIIRLCSHKKTSEEINQTELGVYEKVFVAEIKGTFSTNSIPCDTELKLRVGARVMILVNDNKTHRYQNGTLGIIRKINEKQNELGESIVTIEVETDEGDVVSLDKNTWRNYKYTTDKDGKIQQEEIGSCSQYPLTLAWAITIHKSQGLTFDSVIVDSGRSFAPGQVYVALSRCRSLEGLFLLSYVTKKSIPQNEELLRFENSYNSHDNFYGFGHLE